MSRVWLEAIIRGDATFALSKMTLSAVVRIATNRRFYPAASTLEDAFGFCDDLMTQPHCQLIEPGERHWDIFRRLCVETGTRGGETTDAWFAALAIELVCESGLLRRSAMNWSNSALSLAKRRRSRKSRNSRCSSSRRRRVSVRYSSKAWLPLEGRQPPPPKLSRIRLIFSSTRCILCCQRAPL